MPRRRVLSETGALVRLRSLAVRDEQLIDGVRLRRGQAFVSRRGLAAELGWSPAKVHRWLQRLADEGAIDLKNETAGTVVSLGIPAVYPSDSGRRETSDRIEDVGERIVAATGVPVEKPLSIHARGLIRTWLAWGFEPDEIVEIAARATPNIVRAFGGVTGVEPFHAFIEAARYDRCA